jgi:hypothetical protein
MRFRCLFFNSEGLDEILGRRQIAFCVIRNRASSIQYRRRQGGDEEYEYEEIVRDPSTSLPPPPELRRGKHDDKKGDSNRNR